MSHYDPTLTRDPVASYIERHNHGVRTGDFEPLLELFAEDAQLHFRGIPHGPFSGIREITAVFDAHPPDDELIAADVVGNGTSYRARYAWRSAPDLFEGEIIMMIDEGRITSLLITRKAVKAS
jgi:hypothetical protein